MATHINVSIPYIRKILQRIVTKKSNHGKRLISEMINIKIKDINENENNTYIYTYL